MELLLPTPHERLLAYAQPCAGAGDQLPSRLAPERFPRVDEESQIGQWRQKSGVDVDHRPLRGTFLKALHHLMLICCRSIQLPASHSSEHLQTGKPCNSCPRLACTLLLCVAYMEHIACKCEDTLVTSALHGHVSDMLLLAAHADATIAAASL